MINTQDAQTRQFLGTRPPHLIHQHQDEFDQLPTLVETPAIKGLLAIRDRFVTCPLTLDSNGCPYVKLYDAYECTPVLARQITEYFYVRMHEYPVELVLCADRFFPFGQQIGRFLYPKYGLIPYHYEGGYVDYSIMARGRTWG